MSISLLDEIPRQQGYSGDLNEADNSWVVRKTEEIFDQYCNRPPDLFPLFCAPLLKGNKAVPAV